MSSEKTMTENLSCRKPIAIGGLGGSGTRIVVEILKSIGFYIGCDLNRANDNLWFTLLLKRPKFFNFDLNNNKNEIFNCLNIFEKAMTANLSPNIFEFLYILKIAIGMSYTGNSYRGEGKKIWPFKRVQTLMSSKKVNFSSYLGWGWKEPNTHIFLEYLAEFFKDLKYIHVIRHGLDIAFSSNQSQLHHWGHLFGVNVNSSGCLPGLMLKFWIQSNLKTISLARRILKENFIVLNYDKLCLNPEKEIIKLIEFLQLSENNINIDQLTKIPKITNSIGRYKTNDISIFSNKELEEVENFGFEVDF